MRLIRERDRRIKTGVPRSTWYALMAEGIAPKPVKLGPRSVAWIEDELEAWMRELDRTYGGGDEVMVLAETPMPYARSVYDSCINPVNDAPSRDLDPFTGRAVVDRRWLNGRLRSDAS